MPNWNKMSDRQVLEWMRAPGPLVDGFHELCNRYVQPGMIILEVGSFAGATARMLHESMRGQGILYCVDSWAHGWYGERDADVASERVFDQWSTQHPETVRKLKMLSSEAAPLIDDGSLDMIYIDATKEEIERDVPRWTPKLKPGGVLAGHDHSEHYPDVQRYLNDRFAGMDLQLFQDTSWAVRLA